MNKLTILLRITERTHLQSLLKNRCNSLRTKIRIRHLLRNLNIDKQPVELLSKVKNLKIKDLENSDECCGFGGGFSVKYPEISDAIMNRKIKSIRKSGADTVIGCDMGCLMNLEGGMRRSDTVVKIRHIAQVLAEGLR